MNILYTLNTAFIPQVAASIASILENNQSANEITFYLIHTDISNQNQDKFIKFIESWGQNRNVRFVQIKEIQQYFDFEFDTNGWNPIIIARLLVDRLLPDIVERVLYLDGDTIVRGSLDDLWNVDLSNHILAMGPEPTASRERKELLNLRNLPYHNSGVLLINLKKWRELDAGKIVLEYFRENKQILFATDQDAINGALKEHILSVSPKYNFFNIYTTYPYKTLKRLSEPNSFISKKLFTEAANNPVIVHYLGEERPWRVGNHHKYRDDYLKYLTLTPWREANLEKGWELYFKCFYIFDFLLTPFPMLRYHIINGLIPYFMKFRKRKLQSSR